MARRPVAGAVMRPYTSRASSPLPHLDLIRCNMLQLKAMGGLALERDGEVLAGPVAQRKRLAILLLLLHAGRTGVTRERLVAWLWPDSDEGRARHALDQSLYVLRRTLGADAFTEGTALRLGPDVVTSDVLSIEAAAAQADDQGVVRAYAGPFLDGVHFSDAPDLERWADGVRARLAALYANALERLALAAETEGDWRSAAGWWRRAVEEDPYATASTVRFVRVLALAGDRGAAPSSRGGARGAVAWRGNGPGPPRACRRERESCYPGCGARKGHVRRCAAARVERAAVTD